MVVDLNVLSPESCNDCGLCCEGIGSPVLWYTSSHETMAGHPFRPEGLPAELAAEIDAAFGGLFRGQEPQESCLWYDAERRCCRHYEWRPQVCRDYELGGRACLERREIERDSRAD
ncbi:MAG: YkgJ family cysteine cluster protein [Planctomycetaceae bacterium]|nr:YkgJ family cysteine cluster protein [Planctomycetaceae bacterium]MBT6157589.1 YkgJ family cysteine cluster protein [Planctomycetaceae bacterium]MBT6486070.1 YkgJ family cysteine cluster protein [Planctomycetaceae bacterium]